MFAQYSTALGDAQSKLKNAISEVMNDAKFDVEKEIAQFNKVSENIKNTMDEEHTDGALDAAKRESQFRIDKIIDNTRTRIRQLASETRDALSLAYAKQVALGREKVLAEEKEKAEKRKKEEATKELSMGPSPAAGNSFNDNIQICLKGGAVLCPLMKPNPAPLTAHPLCSCEERIQMQDQERTQYLDYYYNRFDALRKCRGEICSDCVVTLKAIIYDLSPTMPDKESRWCTEAFKLPNARCVPMIKG